MIPKHLQPFPPGARVRLIRGGDPAWEGYATGGFVRLSRKSELQVQVYWVQRTERVNLGTEKEPLWEKVQLGEAPVFGSAGEIDKTTTEYVKNLELVGDSIPQFEDRVLLLPSHMVAALNEATGRWSVREEKLPRYTLKGYMAAGVRYSIRRK